MIVPVLSIQTRFISAKLSRAFPDLIITPLDEATPIPDTITIGVAMTNAQGQATTITTKPLYNQV